MPHAGALLKEGAIDVELRFGEPFAFDVTSDRKAIAALQAKCVGSRPKRCAIRREAGESSVFCHQIALEARRWS